MSRDPLRERGWPNLPCFLGNGPISAFDLLGREPYVFEILLGHDDGTSDNVGWAAQIEAYFDDVKALLANIAKKRATKCLKQIQELDLKVDNFTKANAVAADTRTGADFVWAHAQPVDEHGVASWVDKENWADTQFGEKGGGNDFLTITDIFGGDGAQGDVYFYGCYTQPAVRRANTHIPLSSAFPVKSVDIADSMVLEILFNVSRQLGKVSKECCLNNIGGLGDEFPMHLIRQWEKRRKHYQANK